MAAPRCISKFFNERSVASEKILTTVSERKKMCFLREGYTVKFFFQGIS